MINRLASRLIATSKSVYFIFGENAREAEFDRRYLRKYLAESHEIFMRGTPVFDLCVVKISAMRVDGFARSDVCRFGVRREMN